MRWEPLRCRLSTSDDALGRATQFDVRELSPRTMSVCVRQPAGWRRGGLPWGAVRLERAPGLRSASWSAWPRARGQRRLLRRWLSRSGPSSGRARVGLDRANRPQQAWRCRLKLTRARQTRLVCESALNLAAFRDPEPGIYAGAEANPRVAVANQVPCGHTGGLSGRRAPS